MNISKVSFAGLCVRKMEGTKKSEDFRAVPVEYYPFKDEFKSQKEATEHALKINPFLTTGIGFYPVWEVKNPLPFTKAEYERIIMNA